MNSMKSVKEIYDFFLQATNSDKHQASLLDLLGTLPEFNQMSDNGISTMNMSLGKEYLTICDEMCKDFLLLKVKDASVIQIDAEYIAVPSVNSDNPQDFMHTIEYGMYDFKYRGFTHVHKCFSNSVSPIVGKNRHTGNEDIGTCYYIGRNMFVTAAHCVKGLEYFNILLPDDTSLELTEVWFAKDENLDDFDLAIILCKNVPQYIKAFELSNANVLDKIMIMGYPPIPGLNPVLISETASVGSYVEGRQKASIGQVVAETGSYMSKLDFFIITARVKGGNSGSPVINREGYVIGTVFQIPFDSQKGADEGRYDILGYGICLPSKYIESIIKDHESHKLFLESGSYKE